MKKILSGLIAIALACSLSACKKDPEIISLSGISATLMTVQLKKMLKKHMSRLK